MMATKSDELVVVEPDWLAMESRQIDELGPKFAALVDTLMARWAACLRNETRCEGACTAACMLSEIKPICTLK
jgi:hypothetical protein